jgi:hypothetical protein
VRSVGGQRHSGRAYLEGIRPENRHYVSIHVASVLPYGAIFFECPERSGAATQPRSPARSIATARKAACAGVGISLYPDAADAPSMAATSTANRIAKTRGERGRRTSPSVGGRCHVAFGPPACRA